MRLFPPPLLAEGWYDVYAFGLPTGMARGNEIYSSKK